MVTRSYGSADSIDRNSSNPVIARTPAPFKPRPVSSGMSTQQLIRNLEYNNQNVPFVSGAQMTIDENKQSDIDAQIELDKIAANFGNSIKGFGSGSGAKPMSASDILARDNFNYDQNVASGKYQGLLDYFNNKSWKPGFDSLRGLLDDQNTTGTKTINDAYDTRTGQISQMLATGNTAANNAYNTRTGQISQMLDTGNTAANDSYNSRMAQIAQILASGNTATQNVYGSGMKNIGQGYDTASGMTSNAYNALDAYLKANQTNPYENYQSSFTPSQNAMSSYLDAYGVSNDPVNQQVQAENVSGQQGADAFAELNKVLGSIANQSNLSRLAESQFGRTGATTALSSQRAGYESNADMVRQNALQKLLAESQGQEFDAGNSLQDALSGLLTTSQAQGFEAGNTLQGSLDALTAGSQTAGFEAGNIQQKGLADLLAVINAGNFDITQNENAAATTAEQAALAAYVPPVGTATKTPVPAAPAPQTDAPTFKAAVADLHPNFKGTLAEAKKKFPKLFNQYK